MHLPGQPEEKGSDMSAPEAYMLCLERCAEKHGKPLPQRLLTMGDADHGWGYVVNPTSGIIAGYPAFTVALSWNGWPAGILDPAGGMVAAGAAANEDSLCEWLNSLKEES